jgi:hypothetical protein
MQGSAKVAEQPLPGTYTVTEGTGDSQRTVLVPETAHLAPQFGTTRLVPGRRGAIPNGPAAFVVHHTPQKDLRWLTRVASQRNSGNVPIHGPADVPYFEKNCPPGHFSSSTAKVS